jgi:hypothetical protein
VGGGCVPWGASVNDRYPPPCPSEHQRGAQSGGAATDYNHVVVLSFHASSVPD